MPVESSRSGGWPVEVAAGSEVVDVIVIGAGLVGAAIARELAGHEVSVELVEARDDVGDGTSKANTAILHTGFDASPGTLEGRLVRRGYELLGRYAELVGIPVERTGAVLVAWTEEELAALPALRDKAIRNDYLACELLGPAQVYALVPALAPGVRGGLGVPGESITCTWTTTLALATEAVTRGVRLRTGTRVTGVQVGDATSVLHTDGCGRRPARWVVNAAGLGAAQVDRLFGHERFTVTPRRGELVVFDKAARPLAPAIVLPVPSSLGKGVLVAPTVYGNVMLGPTAEDLTDPTATGTSEEGLEFLRRKGTALMPSLLAEEVTAAYAGLRAATEHGDYLIDVDAAQRYALVGGIRSTGLTACLAIAEHVAGLLAEAGLELRLRDDLPAPPRMPQLGEAGLRPYQDGEAIDGDPAYGRIVCFCERVTAGEIRDVYASPVRPADLGGLRRRTRAMNGRCQGFACEAAVRALADRAGRS